MPLPKFQDIEIPLKEWLKDGKERSLQEAIEFTKAYFKISDEVAAQILPSGKETVLQNRIRWAKVSLQQQGIVERTRRGYFRLANKPLETPATLENAEATEVRFAEAQLKAESALLSAVDDLKQLLIKMKEQLKNDKTESPYLAEKLRRWHERTVRAISLNVSANEAERLRKMEPAKEKWGLKDILKKSRNITRI